MDFRFNEEQVAFQQEIRAFFAEEMAPEKTEGRGERKEMYGYDLEFERALRRKTGDRGYLGVAWPEEYGGQAKGMFYQAILGYEAAYAAAPAVDISVSIVAAPLMLFGTPEQKEFFLPKILKGEINFCLGYSEPGAGSDLAGLSTRAERVDGGFVLNGQKVWTSYAQFADWGVCLARTNPDVKKQAGISYLVVDMSPPGVDVRPFRQLTAEAEQEALERGFVIEQRAHRGEVLDAAVPALNVDEAHAGALAGVDFHRAGNEAAGSGGDAFLDHRDAAVRLRDDKQVREDRDARRRLRHRVLDRQLYLDALRHVDETAAAPKRAVQA